MQILTFKIDDTYIVRVDENKCSKTIGILNRESLVLPLDIIKVFLYNTTLLSHKKLE